MSFSFKSLKCEIDVTVSVKTPYRTFPNIVIFPPHIQQEAASMGVKEFTY